MLQLISKTGKIIKEVFIIRRYEIKRGTMAGSICNVVRSIKTVKKQEVVNEYQVWTLRDGAITCDCKAPGDCCHKLEAACSEMRRCNTIAPVKTRRQRLVEQTARTLDIPAEEVAKIATIAERANEQKRDAIAQHQAELLAAAVNAELARVNAPAATPEEIAATQASLLQPDDVDQIAYFVQWNRRSAAIKPVPTPTVRKVSEDWLLKGSCGGQFSGRVA